MNAIKIIGVVLIVAGIIALAYGHFTYTKESHDAKLGNLELSYKEKETVRIPPWAGWVGIGVGVIILLLPFTHRP